MKAIEQHRREPASPYVEMAKPQTQGYLSKEARHEEGEAFVGTDYRQAA